MSKIRHSNAYQPIICEWQGPAAREAATPRPVAAPPRSSIPWDVLPLSSSQAQGRYHFLSTDYGVTYKALPTPASTEGYAQEIRLHPRQPDWLLARVRRNECLIDRRRWAGAGTRECGGAGVEVVAEGGAGGWGCGEVRWGCLDTAGTRGHRSCRLALPHAHTGRLFAPCRQQPAAASWSPHASPPASAPCAPHRPAVLLPPCLPAAPPARTTSSCPRTLPPPGPT